MEETVSRQQFLDLMKTAGGEDLAEDLLARLGLGHKERLTEQDVSTLMLAANHAASEQLGQRPGGNPAKDAHMKALLEAVNSHAIPVLGKQFGMRKQGNNT